MNRPCVVALAALAVVTALASGPVRSQADNSNSLTFTDQLWTALFDRTPDPTQPRSPLDEALRRPGGDRHAEGLSAAELGMLYGSLELRDTVEPPTH